jgi:phosphatidate phosphatase APP1
VDHTANIRKAADEESVLLTYGYLQDSFEDASDMTPRPDSHSERSRSRSLLKKHESSSTSQEDDAESPLSEVPAVPMKANEGVDKPKSEHPGEDAPSAKSPLLTTHRISVTSDMDDVALGEGAYNSFQIKRVQLAVRS